MHNEKTDGFPLTSLREVRPRRGDRERRASQKTTTRPLRTATARTDERRPSRVAREVRLLWRVRHPHCVELKAVAVGRRRDAVFLVFEYCEHDLAALVDQVIQW